MKLQSLALAAVFTFLASAASAAPPLEQLGEFPVKEANQGIGVDAGHFYAVDNTVIAKYDKKTGKLVKKWEEKPGGRIEHLDSAVVVDGKIYASHSNYPKNPMRSSVEIFDAATMEHIGTHDFGTQLGSFTWLDWHDGYWWAGFANYDRLLGPNKTPYGGKVNTVTVKYTKDFLPLAIWTLPKAILDRFEDMSNSGGSWGPDGFLYLSGHDPAEIYKMRPPKDGGVLEHLDTVPMNIRGQGIAWDRSQPGVIYGIIRATAEERKAGGSHKVTVSRVPDKK